MKQLKIKSVTIGEKQTVHDITVKDVHHYILDNGVVAHNTQEMFPREVFSGGCLNADAKVLMADGSYKQISDIKQGDWVETLMGAEIVAEKVVFQKEAYEITFSNGSVYKCSDDHRFLTSTNWDHKAGWTYVTKMKEGQNVLLFDNKYVTTEDNMFDEPEISKDTTVISVKKLEGKYELHDICIENASHYILEDGIISHNTGAIYNASIILMLSKAKLKDGNEDEQDLGQSGIIVSAKTQKNRLAKPKKIKFELSFNKGSNPYSGLEFWCTPENFDVIGIAKGKPVIEDVVDKSTGEIIGKKTSINPGGNFWYIRHLDKSVPTTRLNTKEVFTPEVLNAMAPILEDYFKYRDMDELQTVEEELDKISAEFEEHGNADEVDAGKLFE